MFSRELVIELGCKLGRLRASSSVARVSSRVQLVPEVHHVAVDFDGIVKVEIDWTMVGTHDLGQDVGVFDPRQEARRDENVVEASAVVGGTARDASQPG